VPSETWVPKPNITGISVTSQGVQIDFQAVPGYLYTVQSTDSLNSTNQWKNLGSTNIDGIATPTSVTDPTFDSARYYRLLRQPAP
jgi:hypothetical protein